MTEPLVIKRSIYGWTMYEAENIVASADFPGDLVDYAIELSSDVLVKTPVELSSDALVKASDRYQITGAGFLFCKDCGCVIMEGYRRQHDFLHPDVKTSGAER
jgi:hypothetical protein